MLTIHDFANATYRALARLHEIPGTRDLDRRASPTPEEFAFLERALGVKPPTLERMSEIESIEPALPHERRRLRHAARCPGAKPTGAPPHTRWR